jgi:two-component system nitrogen regulation response regulator NtrX
VAQERILVVDDEPGVRVALEGILGDEGYEVASVESGEAALEAIADNRYDAILLDVWLPGIDGIETLQELGERRTDAQIVMISGHGNIETAVRATKLGAFDFVEKPLSLEKTLLVLRNALRQRRLELRNRQLLGQLARQTAIVGKSAASRRLREQVEIAAGSDAPVLLSGAPGSGRESAARRIHGAGARAAGPFVEIPCAALTAERAETALFGDGGTQAGRIALAAAGTLYLEDVDRLPAELQRTLASRLGAELRSSVPARPIGSISTQTATLDDQLRGKLEVIRIEVPSLGERRPDIPLIAERMLADLAREYGREVRQLSSDSLKALKAHDWPGNVAELRNLMERLLLYARGERIELSDLPEGLGGEGAAVEDLYGDLGPLARASETFERYYVGRILSEENDDREAAARRLGLTAEELAARLSG